MPENIWHKFSMVGCSTKQHGTTSYLFGCKNKPVSFLQLHPGSDKENQTFIGDEMLGTPACVQKLTFSSKVSAEGAHIDGAASQINTVQQEADRDMKADSI